MTKITFHFLLIAMLAFVVAHFSQRLGDTFEFNTENLEEYSILPNKKTLPSLSLGYKTVLADLIWIRALQYNSLKNEANLVQHFADAIIELDPDFEPVYKWAAISTLFTEKITAESVENSNHYLKLAHAKFPSNYYYPHSIGLNYTSYYNSNDPQKRAEARAKGVYYLQQTMLLPGAPPNLAMLISGLLTNDDEATKINFLSQAVLIENDANIRKNLQMRLFTLSNEYHPSLLLNAKRDHWRQEHRAYLPLMLDYLLSDKDDEK